MPRVSCGFGDDRYDPGTGLAWEGCRYPTRLQIPHSCSSRVGDLDAQGADGRGSVWNNQVFVPDQRCVLGQGFVVGRLPGLIQRDRRVAVFRRSGRETLAVQVDRSRINVTNRFVGRASNSVYRPAPVARSPKIVHD